MTHASGPPTPRVSIITIFLNAEVFIAEAIESVLAQSYQDFELILGKRVQHHILSNWKHPLRR